MAGPTGMAYGGAVVDLRRCVTLPTALTAADGLPETVLLTPPPGSLVVPMARIAPDKERAGQDYGSALSGHHQS
jgi:hypothetical protein